MKVTLHEVAARADVSIATVSRALNGLPVSKENLARVRKAVNELGYVANEAARALRSDRTMTMGLVFADLRNTLGIELLDALSEAIEDAGYALLISTARGDGDRYDTLMRHFLERRVDALFCIRPRGQGELLVRYHAANIPVMTLFNASAAFADLPAITPSFTDPAKALGKYLRGHGHKRVAILRQDARAGPQVAIADSLKAQGLSIEAVEQSETEGMSDVLATLLAKRNPPTAIVAPDPHVRGLIAACAHVRVRVPEDMSIISISEISAESYHRKHAISAVTVDPHRMGKAAGAAMLAWLSGSAPADKIRVQAAVFTARATTGPAPRAR